MRMLRPTVDSITDLARDLRAIAQNREAVAERAALLRRKIPSIGRGLLYLLKKNKQEALSIGTFIQRNAEERPHDPAILYEDRRITHRELHEESNRWAHLLARSGIRAGDAVGVFLENRPEVLFVVGGIVKLGAVAAVINTKQRQHVLAHSFRVSKARMFVIGEELWDPFAEVRASIGDLPRDRVVWIRDGEGGGAAPEGATDADLELVRMPKTAPSSLASVKLGDPCFYVYTSGTTGMPKASIMSHFRWVKAAGAFGHAALALDASDTMYVPLPFYHNNALTVAWASAATAGAAIAMRRKFSVTHFWDDVRRYGATTFVYIGELLRYLMNQPPNERDRDHRVRRIIGNGLRPDIWEAFKGRFGVDEVYEFYAASEGNIAFVNLFNLDATVGFCPAKYEIVKYDIDQDTPVRDADGRLIRVRRGEVGLLIGEISDRYAFDGYTDKSASEKKILRDVFAKGDAWFNSGDLVRDQGFGHAQFVDRVGDTFRWKGENVSTNEVAEVLNSFAQIAESTVYGVSVPGAEGRCGMAAVVARVPLDHLDFEGLLAHLRRQLPAYALPHFLRFQSDIEVTGTFKQVKGDLRKQGFDKGAISEPLFVLLPKAEGYIPLTDELCEKIKAGAFAF